MDKSIKLSLREEVFRDAERIAAEIEADPKLENVRATPEMDERLARRIRDWEDRKEN